MKKTGLTDKIRNLKLGQVVMWIGRKSEVHLIAKRLNVIIVTRSKGNYLAIMCLGCYIPKYDTKVYGSKQPRFSYSDKKKWLECLWKKWLKTDEILPKLR